MPIDYSIKDPTARYVQMKSTPSMLQPSVETLPAQGWFDGGMDALSTPKTPYGAEILHDEQQAAAAARDLAEDREQKARIAQRQIDIAHMYGLSVKDALAGKGADVAKAEAAVDAQMDTVARLQKKWREVGDKLMKGMSKDDKELFSVLMTVEPGSVVTAPMSPAMQTAWESYHAQRRELASAVIAAHAAVGELRTEVAREQERAAAVRDIQALQQSWGMYTSLERYDQARVTAWQKERHQDLHRGQLKALERAAKKGKQADEHFENSIREMQQGTQDVRAAREAEGAAQSFEAADRQP
jgi:hypothetical protein